MNKHPNSMTADEIAAERYVPTGAVAIHQKADYQVYWYAIPQTNALGGCAFIGKSVKAAWRYRFRNEAERAVHTQQWVDGMERSIAAKAERKAARKAPHTLVVGDVLVASWGWEQTNIDYYQVVDVVGAHTVDVRRIASDSENTGPMSGTSVPRPNVFIGKITRHRVSENGVRISECQRATLHPPQGIVFGIPVWQPLHWSSWA